jgi:hypothetical protein
MIRYSVFENTVSTEPMMVESSWVEFVETMAEFAVQARPATGQEKGYNTPMISPAVYGEESTRKNANVECLGGWTAIDLDKGVVTFDEVITILDAVPVDHVVHTTTKSVPTSERMRAILPLSRDVLPHEATAFWAGCFEFFGRINDIQTKDISRIYAVPAQWDGSTPRFAARFDGNLLDVDEMITHAPVVEPPTPVSVSKTQLSKIRAALAGHGKLNTDGQSIYDSRVVHSRFIETYLNLPKGDHHRGLYQFMAKIAERGFYLGLAVTPSQLADYARQLDNISAVKTSKTRWSRILGEAQTATQWAQKITSEKDYSIK